MPLRQLYPDPGSSVAEAAARVDIIAVHGLNPRNKGKTEHAWDTWREPSRPDGCLWLRDKLPRHLPESRIFLYEYNATVVYGRDRDTFIGKANELLEEIRIERDEVESRPIIFLGHSMGGLLIKQALINAHSNPKYTPIKSATSGLAFFATPHNGGDGMLVSLGGLAAKMAKTLGFQKGDNVVNALESGSMFSDIMNEHWRHQLLAYDIVSFWGAFDDAVPRESARLGLPGDRENIVKLEADHRGVCKFGESQTDQDNLKLVRVNLQDLYKSALKHSDRDATNKLLSDKHLPIHYIPFSKNTQFTGRNGILDELKEKFFVRKQCQRLAVFGLGGVGKTQLALHFAYWVKDNQPEYSVFWVPVLSDGSFDQAYTELARRLSIPVNKDNDLKESVQRHLSSRSAGKWLMIMDNADDYELLFGSEDKPGGINECLPQSEDGLILFTTRARKVAFSAAGSDVVDLKEMTFEEAMSFLEKKLIRETLLRDASQIKELLQELTYLPLAIAQATAYMNINQTSVEKYIPESAARDGTNREFHDNTRYSGSRNAVATTWLVSFDEIRKSDNAAADLLSFISHIESKAIPQSILPNRGSDEEMENAIGTLLGYTFLVRREEEDMFDMHRLVHMASRIWLRRHHKAKPDNSVTLDPITVKVVQHLNFIFPSHNRINRDLWRRYIPHTLRALEGSRECQIEERYELFYRVGRCLSMDYRYKETVETFEEAYTWRKEHVYENPDDQLELEMWLAGAYHDHDHGRVEEAIEKLERIAGIRKQTLAEESYRRLNSEHELGFAYIRGERIKEAVEILEHVVNIRRKTLAEGDDDRLASEHELAKAYIKGGRAKEAIEIFEYVVAIQRNILAEEADDRLTSELELGRAYLVDGRVEEAIKIFEYILTIPRRLLAEEHRGRLASEYCLADAYLDINRVDEAIEILEHVVSVEANMADEDAPEKAWSLKLLDKAYSML